MKNIRAKKSLGQNFLHDKSVVLHIAAVSHVATGDTVVEVGPGEGALTEALLRSGARVIAIEKDHRLIPYLTEKFSEELQSRTLILIEGDILDEHTTKDLYAHIGDAPYKVVANIPYYITGLLFRYFFEHVAQPTQLTFLVQKEVAENIASKEGKESILSLSVKIFGDPHIAGIVSRDAFLPVPNVDSAILVVSDISKARLKTLTEENFFSVVKAGFRAKRKMLIGNLADGLAIEKSKINQAFSGLSIDEKIRAEDLPLSLWSALAIALTKK
jgi:16S rRNA (adenine1518-N6/adenine1519-N6)-dimethyltransferase